MPDPAGVVSALQVKRDRMDAPSPNTAKRQGCRRDRLDATTAIRDVIIDGDPQCGLT
jgi:hypothetical protein